MKSFPTQNAAHPHNPTYDIDSPNSSCCCYTYLQVVLIGTMWGAIVEITYIYLFATMLHELREHPSFL